MDNQKTKIKLKVAKTLDGNIVVYDHPKVIFIISPAKRKVTMIAKENVNDDLFPVQKRFMDFAIPKGIVVLGTESTGYLPNMFEFIYPEDQKRDTLKIMLKFFHEFILKEKEIYKRLDKYEQDLESRLLDPDEEHSTELGEIPHGEKKGSLRANPYLNYMNSWFGWGL